MQSKQKKILVLDDDPDILEFLQAVLEEAGFLVVTADKGERLEKLNKRPLPELILLDMLHSGKDGGEIIRRVKSQQKTKHIPVIMVSGYPKAEQTALAAGADDFVEKPFDIQLLLQKIARYV